MSTVNISTEAKSLSAGQRLMLVNDSTEPAAKEDGRCTYEIFNDSSETVFLGGADVTVESGIPLPPGTSRTIGLRIKGRIFGIAAEAATVRVMRVP